MSKKKILIVVDMQNDFITGKLKSKEAEKILPNIVDKIKKNNYDAVYATLDTHYNDYLKTQEGKKLPVEHCIKYSVGWCLPDELSEVLLTQNTIFIEKHTFGSVNLANQVQEFVNKNNDIKIEIVGVCTDICVISNALYLKSFIPDNIIELDASCCAGSTIENHLKALDVMESCQIEIVNRN